MSLPCVSPTGHPKCSHDKCENYAFFAALNPAFPGLLHQLCAHHAEALINACPGKFFFFALTPLHSKEVLAMSGRTRSVNLEHITALEKLDAEQAREAPTQGSANKFIVYDDGGTPADKPKVKEFQTSNGWGIMVESNKAGLHVGNASGVGLSFQPQAQVETKDHVPVKTAAHEFSPLTGWCFHCGVTQSHQLAGKPCPRVA